MKQLIYLLFITIVSVQGITSCTINTDLMLRTDKDYIFAELTDSVINSAPQYVLAPNDIIQFRMYDNDGFVLLEQGISGRLQEGNNTQRNNFITQPGLSYMIESDGTVKLPELDTVRLSGLTIRQTEDTLEALYSENYVKPFVQLNVTNKRVIVFPGSGGDAKVVSLKNNNTTLMEVLASVGGIAQRGRAEQIKLMRKIDGQRVVYSIDLSDIENIKYTDMLVRANDYIYIEPVPEIGREIIRDIAPIVSILSSALLVYTVVRTINN